MTALFLLWIPLFTTAQSNSGNDFSYALKLYEQKFYDLAAQQFIRYYNTYPGSNNVDEAKFYAGMSLYNLKDYTKARVEFQSLALEYPKSPRAAEAWFKVGDCYQALQKHAEAAKAFETVKTLYPTHALAPQSLLRASRERRLSGDVKSTIVLLQAVLDRYPDSKERPAAMLRLAEIYLERNDLASAERMIDALLLEDSSSGEYAGALLLKGRADLLKGLDQKALENFDRILRDFGQSPEAVKAAMLGARLALGQGDQKAGLKYLSSAERVNTDKTLAAEIAVLKGDLYFADKKYALAEESYAAVQQASDSLQAYLILKRFLAFHYQQNQTQALKMLDELHPLFSFLAGGVRNRLLELLLDSRQAGAGLRLIVSDSRDVPRELSYWQARFLRQEGRWQQLLNLLEDMQNLSRAGDKVDELYFYLAETHYQLKNYNDALKAINKLITRYPAGRYVEKALEIKQNIENFDLLNETKAIRGLARLNLQALMGEQQSGFISLGRIYFEDLKDYDTAARVFEIATQKTPAQKGLAYLWLGRVYDRLSEAPALGESEKRAYRGRAMENFRKAVENIETCDQPDVASWMMVKTRLESDTVSSAKIKSYIAGLLAKYPESPLKEEWLAYEAYTFSFDSAYGQVAGDDYRRLIQNYKKSGQYPSYLFNYARLIEEASPAEALELYKEIALEYPNSFWADKALLAVARSFARQADYTAAISLYEKYLDQYAYTDAAAEVEEEMARLYVLTGQNEKAIRLLATRLNINLLEDPVLAALAYGGASLEKLAYLAQAYDQNGQTRKAISFYGLYLRLAPAGGLAAQSSFALAGLYRKSGQENVALDLYARIRKDQEPYYTKAQMQRADIYFEQMNYSKAAELYGSLTGKENSEAQKAHAHLIVSLIKAGKTGEAEKQLKQFKNRYAGDKQNFARFTLEFGEYYRKKKNFTKALKYFKNVSSKYGDTPWADNAAYSSALVKITLNKHEEALSILSAFPQKFPDSDMLSSVYNSLGTIYFRGEAYDKAISAFKKALEYPAGKIVKQKTMSNLIKTYSMTGFWDAAQSLARSYVQQFPRAEDRIDKDILIAQAFINLNQYQNAVDYLKRIKISADSEKEPEIQYYIGEALLKAGRYEEAIAEFVKIPLLSKKTKLQWEASALYYSGQAYEKLGRIDDAIRMYREIINRPGIDLILKREAEKRIGQIKGKG